MHNTESFWNNLHSFVLQHNQYGLLLIVMLIMSGMVWRWRPLDRKALATALLFLIFAVIGLLPERRVNGIGQFRFRQCLT